MKPLVTVVIPTYRRQDKLVKAVRSVLNQTIDPSLVEIIICEDGESLASSDFIRNAFDCRVRYLPSAHFGGPAVPRNNGLLHANGDWICFLDDDDVWHPDKLIYQLALIRKFKARMCAQSFSGLDVSSPRFVGTFDFFSGNPIVTSSVMISRDLLVDLRFKESNAFKGEDYHLWLRLAVLDDWLVHDYECVEYEEFSPDSVRLQSDIGIDGLQELVFVSLDALISLLLSFNLKILSKRLVLAITSLIFYCIKLMIVRFQSLFS